MQATDERRALGSNRIPFDGLVEVGDGVNDGFEAQAVDISRSGMHLRTAYLPDIGQTLTCRFEMPSGTVSSEASVVWKQDAEQGGEFGVQFTNVDPESEVALQQAFADQRKLPEGTKVRLHIEGLGAPMRARVRTAEKSRVTATSELAFLKLGNALELEDALNGEKRPAKVQGVEVEMDAESRIPKLIVSMRYSDVAETSDSLMPAARTIANESVSEEVPVDDEIADMRSPLAQAFSKVTPALLAASSRAKDSVKEFVKARRAAANEPKDAPQVRRTTSPPPNGGLHASGRKVIRDGALPTKEEAIHAISKNKRTVAISAAVLCTLGLGWASFHKSEPKTTEVAEVTSATTMTLAASTLTLPTAIAPAAAPMPVAPVVMPADQIGASSPGADTEQEAEEVHGKVVPFGHGNVTGGKVIQIKMDGRVARIQGATLPTGFTVVVPKRKSVTTASSLSKLDKRFENVSVTNEDNGASITVAFKDGVPPYLVRAKGDALEVVLGKPSEKEELTKPELKRVGLTSHKRHDVKKKSKSKGKHHD